MGSLEDRENGPVKFAVIGGITYSNPGGFEFEFYGGEFAGNSVGRLLLRLDSFELFSISDISLQIMHESLSSFKTGKRTLVINLINVKDKSLNSMIYTSDSGSSSSTFNLMSNTELELEKGWKINDYSRFAGSLGFGLLAVLGDASPYVSSKLSFDYKNKPDYGFEFGAYVSAFLFFEKGKSPILPGFGINIGYLRQGEYNTYAGLRLELRSILIVTSFSFSFTL